ncbi:MAG: hypothetical protein LRY71_13300 [Bacillaceae bacterium]|nr:hypothetical protein [Bacillaceae bacterium]
MEHFYNGYLRLSKRGTEDVKQDVKKRVKEVDQEIINVEEESTYLKQVMTVASLINMSNSYRRIAERIVDQISEKVSD